MTLNISVPQRQRKNLRIVLNEMRNKKILEGYYCINSCTDCDIKNFHDDRGISVNDLNKKGCSRYNLKTPVFSLKMELTEVEEVMIV